MKRVLAVVWLMTSSVFAQSINLYGTVTNAAGGAALSGVVVGLKGHPGVRDTTDASGAYMLAVTGAHRPMAANPVVDGVRVSGTVLHIDLARPSQLSVEVFTVSGARMDAAVRESSVPAGAYRLDLGSRVSAGGQYYVRVRTGKSTYVKKLLPGSGHAPTASAAAQSVALVKQASGPVDTLTFAFPGFAYQRRAVSSYSGQYDIALHAIAVPQGVTASDGISLDTVRVSWRSSPGATGYEIMRQRIGVQAVVTLGIASDTLFADTSVGPGPFRYRVKAVYGDGQTSAESGWDGGYRKVTNREFLLEYNNTTIYTSQQKIGLLQSQGLGTDSARGDSSGMARYAATFSGTTFRATVSIAYTDYRDDYLTVNGTYTTSASMTGNGTLTGPMTIAGIYSGTVEYAITITSRAPSGGYYRVTQTGGSSEDITFASVSTDLLR